MAVCRLLLWCSVYCTLFILSGAAKITINFTASDLQPYSSIDTPLVALLNDDITIYCGENTVFTLYRLQYLGDLESCNSTCRRVQIVGNCNSGAFNNPITFRPRNNAGALGVFVTYEENTTYYFTSMECPPSERRCLPCQGDQVLSGGLCSEGLKFFLHISRNPNNAISTEGSTVSNTKPSVEGSDGSSIISATDLEVHGTGGVGQSQDKFGSNMIIIIAVVVGGVVLLLVVLIICCCCILWRRKKGHTSDKEKRVDKVALTTRIDTDSIECGSVMTNEKAKETYLDSKKIKKEDIKIMLGNCEHREIHQDTNNIKPKLNGVVSSKLHNSITDDADDGNEYIASELLVIRNGEADVDLEKKHGSFGSNTDSKGKVHHEEKKSEASKPQVAAHNRSPKINRENHGVNHKGSNNPAPSVSLPLSNNRPLPATPPKPPVRRASTSSGGAQKSPSAPKPALSSGPTSHTGRAVPLSDGKVKKPLLPNKPTPHKHSVSSGSRPVRSVPENKAMPSNSNKPSSEHQHTSVGQSEKKSSTGSIGKPLVSPRLPRAPTPENKSVSSNSDKPSSGNRHASVSRRERKSSTGNVGRPVSPRLPVEAPRVPTPENKAASSISNKPSSENRRTSVSERKSTSNDSKPSVSTSLPVAKPHVHLKPSVTQKTKAHSKPSVGGDTQKKPTRKPPSVPARGVSAEENSKKRASDNGIAKT